MKLIGSLLKMETQIPVSKEGESERVIYQLPIGEERIPMNQIIGKKIHLEYLNEIHCIHCGRLTKKSFAQGYCYPCFISLPQTDACILRPELCQAHLGISRDMAWSEKNCLQDHFVYLAISSGLKVGVTRGSQIPTRWIDQGAWKAIRLAKTPNRYLAGLIEVELKYFMKDKTNWRHMLTGQVEQNIDLKQEKTQAIRNLSGNLRKYASENDEVVEIQYPVDYYLEKVKSINLEKEPDFTGNLIGIKGQYLLFKDGHTINIRKYGGYLIRFSVT